MKKNIEIIDNFLPLEYFNYLKDLVFSGNFGWFYIDFLSDQNDNEYYFFKHTIYDNNKIYCNYFDEFDQVFKMIGVNSLIRVMINLSPNLNKKVESTFHNDQDFFHKVAILYFNNTDGPTVLEDGTEIACIENRLVKFDGLIMHKANFCTNNKRRIVMNINYI